MDTDGDFTVAAEPERATPVDLPTTGWKHGDDGEQALISGTLALDENDCVVLDHPDAGTRTYAAWPSGYTATIDAEGLHLINANGIEVARQGDEVEMGGGYGLAHDPHPCLPTSQGNVAYVQSEVTVTSPTTD